MAGMLNLVPRYLPRLGMAPRWVAYARPLVLVLFAIDLLVTLIFRADVEAQGGAYATGVLVLMTSAAVAVTLHAKRAGLRTIFGFITLVFVYTTLLNIYERPEGIKIASWFIATIIVTSMISRVLRSTELRVHDVRPDAAAAEFLRDAGGGPVRILAIRPGDGRREAYEAKMREARESHHLPEEQKNVLFLEIRPGDASDFTDTLDIRGADVGGYRVLRAKSPAIPNAIAALLLHIRDKTGQIPHAYFGCLLKFLAFGEGDTAPVTREVLRQAEPNPMRRPRIHVG
jgi:hypothetical protein